MSEKCITKTNFKYFLDVYEVLIISVKIISPCILKIIFSMLCEQGWGLSEENYLLLKKVLS